MYNGRILTEDDIKAIESVLEKDSRVEVSMDGRDRVNIVEVKRKRVKIENDKPRSKR